MTRSAFTVLLADGPPDGGGDPAWIEGLLQANVSSFTAVNRRIVTAIMDDFLVAWRIADAIGEVPAKSDSRFISIAVAPAARGRTVTMSVTGRHYPAAPPPRITLRVGDAPFDVPLPADEDDQIAFSTDAALPADADIVPFIVEIVIPRPDDPLAEASVWIDSLDVKLA